MASNPRDEHTRDSDVGARPREDDSRYDLTLRPKTLDEYIGQPDLKENLKVYVEAAKQRNEPLDHVLLFGPPGLGKTTLAFILANELGVELHSTSGPAVTLRPVGWGRAQARSWCCAWWRQAHNETA